MAEQRGARGAQRRTFSLRLREASWGTRRSRLAAMTVGVLVLVAAGWWVLRSPDPRSVEETVDEFFDAQRDGDCERLVGLVTEPSWSNGGRWSRDEFLDHCADALDGYEPSPEHFAISVYDEDGDYLSPCCDDDPDEEGDRAIVSVLSGNELWSVYRRGSHGPGGSVVRVDGEWKVDIDDVVLRVGPSIHETVSGYVAAYNDGDCGRLIRRLSERAWSAGGALDRDEFLDRCGDAADARHDRGQPALEVRDIEVRFDDAESLGLAGDVFVSRGTDQVTALVDYPASIAVAVGSDPEEALLVREGMRWKLDGSETRPRGVTSDVQLAAVRSVELQAMFPQEIERGGTRCVRYSDGALREPDPDDEIHYELAVRRTWYGCPEHDASVTLYQFAGDVQARRAAQRMVGDEPVELAGQVPDVSGIPDGAFGAGSTAVVADGRLVVEVEPFLGIGDLHDSARNLVTQVERL